MRFGISALAALTLLATAPAQATTIAYQYVGPECTYGCSNIGVANGTPIALTIYLKSEYVQPGGNTDFYTPGFALPRYSLRIGSYNNFISDDLGFSGHLTADGSTFVTLGSDMNSAGYLYFAASTVPYPSFPAGLKHYQDFFADSSGWSITIYDCDPCTNDQPPTTVTTIAYGYDPSNSATFRKAISLDASVPSTATATSLTVDDFLTPSSVLSELQSWMSAVEDQLPPGAQDELYKIAASPNLKIGAKDAAVVLGVITNATSIASALDSPVNPTAKDLALLGIADANGFVQDVLGGSSGIPDSIQADAGLTTLGIDAALATAECDTPVSCLGGADQFIWQDLVLPQLKQLGDDPPDPNYQSVFVLPDSMTGPIFSTSDETFNAAAAAAYSDLEAAGAYLYAANISLNRYSSALAAGDAVSALNQLQAFAHYVSLYQTAMGNASAEFSLLYSLPEVRDIYDGGIDLSALEAFQQELAANGLSPDELNAFYGLGLTDEQITEIVGDVETYVPTLPLSADQMYTQSQNGFALALGNLDSVDAPEPLTISLFAGGLLGLGFRRRRSV